MELYEICQTFAILSLTHQAKIMPQRQCLYSRQKKKGFEINKVDSAISKTPIQKIKLIKKL